MVKDQISTPCAALPTGTKRIDQLEPRKLLTSTRASKGFMHATITGPDAICYINETRKRFEVAKEGGRNSILAIAVAVVRGSRGGALGLSMRWGKGQRKWEEDEA